MSTILKILCCKRQVVAERRDPKKEYLLDDEAANPPQAEPEAPTESMQQCKTVSWIVIKFLVRVLLFSIVVTCTVFSKLSLISLVSRLNETIDDIRRTNDSEATLTPLHDRAAGIFWQLLFIILIPQFVTLFRALLFGVFKSGPWPTLRAILAVSQRLHDIMILMLVAGGTLPEMYICMDGGCIHV